MTKFVIPIIMLCMVSASFFSSASAHVLEKDGTVGAVLHVDPNDDPIVGEESRFMFEFNDTVDSFSLTDCTCAVEIVKEDEIVYSTVLSTEPVFSYTFPKKGVYTIHVKGASTSNAFKAFTLSYVLRVEKDSSLSSHNSTWQPHLLHYGVFGAGFIVLVGVVLREKNKIKKKKN